MLLVTIKISQSFSRTYIHCRCPALVPCPTLPLSSQHPAGTRCCCTCYSCFLDGQEQLEFRRQLLLAVQPVAEVDAADAAVGMHLHAQRLNVVGACRKQGSGSTRGTLNTRWCLTSAMVAKECSFTTWKHKHCMLALHVLLHAGLLLPAYACTRLQSADVSTSSSCTHHMPCA